MYDFITDLIGTLPDEFTFIYAILTLALSLLLIRFLFELFYIPLKLIERK